MPYVNPFTLPGRWYRGNLHTHTRVSDGALPLAERIAAYRNAGYDFLAITDHGAVSDVSAYTDAHFLVISGSELHPDNPFGGISYHLVALDISQPIDFAGLTANQVIAAVKAQGGEVVVAHPYWCGHSLLDLLPLNGYFAMEVYNDTCMGIGKGISDMSWDELLDKTGPVLGVAVDDAHGDSYDCFHGWIMLKAPALTREAVMSALRAGAFYATQGPEFLEIALQSTTAPDGTVTRTVTVTCAPVQNITFKCQRYLGRRILAPEQQLLTTASFEIPQNAKYLRVEITDAQGHKAWSNPFFG